MIMTNWFYSQNSRTIKMIQHQLYQRNLLLTTNLSVWLPHLIPLHLLQITVFIFEGKLHKFSSVTSFHVIFDLSLGSTLYTVHLHLIQITSTIKREIVHTMKICIQLLHIPNTQRNRFIYLSSSILNPFENINSHLESIPKLADNVLYWHRCVVKCHSASCQTINSCTALVIWQQVILTMPKAE